MTSPSSNNEDKDAWLLKIELKREEPEEINKDEEIEAFKMIELARIQNKYLTQENILLKDHIAGLKGIIRKLEELLCSMCDYPPSSSPPPSPPRT